MPKIVAPLQIEEIATYDLDRKKNQFNFKQIIQILQPIVIDYLSPHLYIVDFFIICFNCYDLRVTYKNIYSCFEDFW